MTRGGILLTGVLTAALAGFAGAATAAADPWPPCSYSLSAPEVVQLDGATMIAATVAPTDCGGPANPRMAVACLQRLGDNSPVRCAQSRGADPARITVPYQPGSYDSTGRGCGGFAFLTEPAPDCDFLGPINAVL